MLRRFGGARYSQTHRALEEVREHAAELIEADSDLIAFAPNTTFGLNLVARGLDFKAGDRILSAEAEFPSNIYPWKALASQGVALDLVAMDIRGRLTLEAIEEAITPATKLVALSWVQYGNGFRLDVKALGELCRERGVLLCLDAIQGLGALAFSVRETPVDFLACGGHKWLMGVEGSGFFYCAAEHLERLRPLVPGWSSVAHRGEFENLELIFAPTARRFEGGSANTQGLLGLGAALSLQNSLGKEPVETYVLTLTKLLADEAAALGYRVLSPREYPGECSGIVTLAHPTRNAADFFNLLTRHDVVCAKRGGGVRLSPHLSNSRQDLEQLLGVLEEVRKNRA